MDNISRRYIALLEDSLEQAERMSAWIESAGDHCVIYLTTDEFQLGFHKFTYDLVILDWTLLEGSSGLEILHWIRETVVSDVPVIFVTIRNSEQDIVTAILAGADDYLVKPVRRLELLARISALIRRSTVQAREILVYPPYEFDATNRELRLNDELVNLTQKEFELALYLFRNKGKPLSREHLLTSLWGESTELTRVRQLRAEIG